MCVCAWLLTMIDPPLRFFGATIDALAFAFVRFDISSIESDDRSLPPAIVVTVRRSNMLERRAVGVIGGAWKGDVPRSELTLGDARDGTGTLIDELVTAAVEEVEDGAAAAAATPVEDDDTEAATASVEEAAVLAAAAAA